MKVNATVYPLWDQFGWRVTCWDHDNPLTTKAYTIRATSDNVAAQEGIRLFLAEHAPHEGPACLELPPA